MPPSGALDILNALHGLADLGLDLFGEFGVVHHQLLRSLAALGELGIIVTEP